MPVNVRRAEAFRALHVPGRPFVLPNAWDAASARTLAALPSSAALGTTSAGIAWSLGRPDGELDRDAMIEVVARVAAAVDVPVTADVEAGYGEGRLGVRLALPKNLALYTRLGYEVYATRRHPKGTELIADLKKRLA